MAALYFTPWMWLIIAMVLLIIELSAPGAWFIWIALAAGATGLLTLQLPFLGPEFQGIIFAVLAIISTWAGRRFFRPSHTDSGDERINSGAERHIGRRLVVTEAISHGVGRVKLGDGIWTAHGADTPAGGVVEVVAVSGIVLEVRPVAPTDEQDKKTPD